jgi:hypothetical protein
VLYSAASIVRHHLISPSIAQTLVTSLVLSRLDYCNSRHLRSSSIQYQSAKNFAECCRPTVIQYPAKHVTDSIVCIGFEYLSVYGYIWQLWHTVQLMVSTAILPKILHFHHAGRSYIRSVASTKDVHGRRSRLFSKCDSSFTAAGGNVFNEWPSDVTLAPSPSTFRSRLNTFLCFLTKTESSDNVLIFNCFLSLNVHVLALS